MNTVQVLRNQADHEFASLIEALDGVRQEHSWAVALLKPGEHMHNNGSILGIVQHVATCKVMDESAEFRNPEVSLRDVVARLEVIGSDWKRTLVYLRESHEDWIDCWTGLADEDLSSSTR